MDGQPDEAMQAAAVLRKVRRLVIAPYFLAGA
jgi:hypothetical protein